MRHGAAQGGPQGRGGAEWGGQMRGLIAVLIARVCAACLCPVCRMTPWAEGEEQVVCLDATGTTTIADIKRIFVHRFLKTKPQGRHVQVSANKTAEQSQSQSQSCAVACVARACVRACGRACGRVYLA